MDSARACLRHPQVFHLHSGPDYGRSHAEGGQDLEGLGLEHWEEEAQGRERCSKGGQGSSQGEQEIALGLLGLGRH